MASDENGNIAESMNGNDSPTTSDIQTTSISNQGMDIYSCRKHLSCFKAVNLDKYLFYNNDLYKKYNIAFS